MKKRIIAVSLCLVTLAFAFAACGKNKGYETNTTTTIEYTTDEFGNEYVTNVNGELIPVTTGADGSVELYEDLITKTEAQVEAEKESIAHNSGNQGDNKPAENTTYAKTTTQLASTGVAIGNADNTNRDAVIDLR